MRRGALLRGAGGVACTQCGARAAADGKGTPIVLRHGANCAEALAPIGVPHRSELFTFWPALNPSDLGVLLADEQVWRALGALMHLDNLRLAPVLTPLRDALDAAYIRGQYGYRAAGAKETNTDG